MLMKKQDNGGTTEKEALFKRQQSAQLPSVYAADCSVTVVIMRRGLVIGCA
jgi:hypothetical protein